MSVKKVFIPGWGFKSDVGELLVDGEFQGLDLPEAMSFQEVVDKLAASIEENSEIIGWSLGGLFAIAIAYKYPRKCKKLILLASSPKFAESKGWPGIKVKQLESFQMLANENISKLLKHFCALVQFPVRDKELRKKLNSYLVEDMKYLNFYLNILAEKDLREEYQNLNCPIFLYFGGTDAILPPTVANIIKDLKADARIDVLHDCNHMAIVPSINLVQKSFEKAVDTYDGNCLVQVKSGDAIFKRLKSIAEDFDVVADLGCGTGIVTERLSQQFNINRLELLDCSEKALHKAKVVRSFSPSSVSFLHSDFDHIFLDENYYSLVFSNMALQWSNDINCLFNKVKNSLETGGLFAFTLPVDGTFSELSFCEINKFYSSNEIINLLRESGFEVLSQGLTKFESKFPNLRDCLRSIKLVGANHVKNRSNSKVFNPILRAKLSKENSKVALTYQIGCFVARKKDA